MMLPTHAGRLLGKTTIVTAASFVCVVFVYTSTVRPAVNQSLPQLPTNLPPRRHRQTVKPYVIEADAKVIRPREYTLQVPVEFAGAKSTFKQAAQLWYHIDDVVREQGYFIERKSSELVNALGRIPAPEQARLRRIVDELVTGNEEMNFVLQNRMHELVDRQGLFKNREQTIERLAAVVDKRIEELQRSSCQGALYCKSDTPWGFASGIHAAVYCLIRGFQLGRRVEFDFSSWHYLTNSTWTDHFEPLSTGSCDPSQLDRSEHLPPENGPKRRSIFVLPVDLAEQLSANLRDPYVWWIGHFVKFILRPSSRVRQELHNMSISSPLVALHIRRGDKVISEADYHGIDEYMRFVNSYMQTRAPNLTEIFVATDDPEALDDLRAKFSHLTFTDNGSSTLAGSQHRDREGAIMNIQRDLHQLTRAEFLVCTLSSGVCRLAFELMAATANTDVDGRVVSLDVPLFYAYVAYPPRLALYHDPGVINETGNAREYLALYPGALLAGRYDRSQIHDVKGRHFNDGVHIGRYLESETLSGNPYVSWKTVPTLHVNNSWTIL